MAAKENFNQSDPHGIAPNPCEINGTDGKPLPIPEVGKSFGPWFVNDSEVIYADPWTLLRKDYVTRPDGKQGTYCVTYIKPGVSVLAIDENSQAFLTKEFHYGVGKETLELVSGGIDQDESPLQAAKRELLEELGIQAGCWTPLGETDPFTANVISPTHLFLATELTHVESQQEGTEVIEKIRLPFSKVVDKVLNSQITHAPTCLAVLKADRMYQSPLGEK